VGREDASDAFPLELELMVNTLARFILYHCNNSNSCSDVCRLSVFKHCENVDDPNIDPTILAQALKWKTIKAFMTKTPENKGLFNWEITLNNKSLRNDGAFGHLPALGGSLFLSISHIPTTDELMKLVDLTAVSQSSPPPKRKKLNALPFKYESQDLEGRLTEYIMERCCSSVQYAGIKYSKVVADRLLNQNDAVWHASQAIILR